MEDKKIQWQQLIELIVVLMTILGSTIPLYMHTDNKLEAVLTAMNTEMKDFHDRLCAIEERNKAK